MCVHVCTYMHGEPSLIQGCITVCATSWTTTPKHAHMCTPYHSHSLIVLCFVGAQVARISEASQIVENPEGHRGHPQQEVHVPRNRQCGRNNLHTYTH